MDKAEDSRGIYRSIYSSVWDNSDFREFKTETKFLFVYLRTSPLCNMPCIFPFYFEAAERHTGLKKSQIQLSLDTLSDTSWIRYEDGYIWIKNGLRFDPNIYLNNPKHLAAIRKILSSFPKLKIIQDFCDYYKIEYPIGYPIAYGMPITEQEQEPEKEPEQDYEKIPKESNGSFELFWSAYPKKIGKKDALNSWTKAKDKPPIEFILKSIETQKQSEQWSKDSGQYIPNPSTWINQGRWDDEPKIKVGHKTLRQIVQEECP